ncbi:DCG1 [Candida pseudojiufengensis]|uniref:DCG1 n=1 Tax=Candida pseudojiufengensis TaxID=497109 RepID=UPI0022253C60|nr:DCG1 [Candida pseudojiufengensis]KAI5960442.1 DCG1 [Candida pseudojiufengensis]
MKILIINPNSSVKVTNNLKDILKVPKGVELSFYTAPSSAPKEITGNETSKLSEEIVLNDIKESDISKDYDGFMVCCYSDHPLIKSLSELSKKPVMGIMQATLLYTLSNPNVKKSFILTSTKEWEPILDSGIVDFFGLKEFPKDRFQKTIGLDINVTNLADEKQYGEIKTKLNYILNDLYSNDHINCVLLGCAGMAGLDSKLSIDFPGIYFIDSCKIATEFLTGLIRFNEQI